MLFLRQKYKCYNCGKLGHRESEWFLGMQDDNQRKYCYWCGGTGHTFTQSEEKNRSSSSDPSSQKKAYKVGRAMLVKK